MRTGQIPPNRKEERGVVLITALLFAMTVLAYSASIITSGVASSNQKRYLIGKQRALSAAESGVYHVLAVLNGPGRGPLLEAGGLKGNVVGDADSKKRVHYITSVTSGAADGGDNDLDGSIDEEDEAEILEVQSTGHADTIVHTVRVTLIARHRTGSLPGAVYIENPLASFAFNGNRFLISGRDVDLNLNETGTLVPGIGIAGSPDQVLEALRSNQEDQVIGEGGDNSIREVTAVDMSRLIDDGIRSAGVVLEPGDEGPESEGEWGTLATPQIVFGSGNYHFAGESSGVGLLIIDGDLKISGQFTWTGVVIVRGKLEFSGGGTTKRVIGGVIVQNGVSDGDLTASGTIDVLYSEAAITRAQLAFAAYSILNWREGPNPTVVKE